MKRTFSRLIFDHGFDEREEYEARERGYRTHVWIELSDGTRHQVTFFDLTRLSQELEREIEEGRPFFAERGLIVLREVSLSNMEIAARGLIEEGFFNNNAESE